MNAWNPNWKTASPEVKRIRAQKSLIEATGHAIRSMLGAHKITQAGLAKRLGKTEGHVSRLLNGRNLRLSTLADICSAVGVQATVKFVDANPALLIVATRVDLPTDRGSANTEVFMRQGRKLQLVAKMLPPALKQAVA